MNELWFHPVRICLSPTFNPTLSSENLIDGGSYWHRVEKVTSQFESTGTGCSYRVWMGQLCIYITKLSTRLWDSLRD